MNASNITAIFQHTLVLRILHALYVRPYWQLGITPAIAILPSHCWRYDSDTPMNLWRICLGFRSIPSCVRNYKASVFCDTPTRRSDQLIHIHGHQHAKYLSQSYLLKCWYYYKRITTSQSWTSHGTGKEIDYW